MMCNALSLGWSVNYRSDNTIEFCKSTDSIDSIDPIVHQLLYPMSPY